jgi:hypothetical protein
MHVAAQYTVLVYPFRHALVGRERGKRLRRLAGAWRPWWQRFGAGAALDEALDGTYFFLPHLRALLFPETLHLVAPGTPEWQEQVARLRACAPARRRRRWPGCCRRTRYCASPTTRRGRPPGCQARGGFPSPAMRARTPRCCPARQTGLTWCCSQQVGLLAIKLRCLNRPLPVNELTALLAQLRTIHPATNHHTVPTWTYGGGDNPASGTARQLVDYLPRDLAEVTVPAGQPLPRQFSPFAHAELPSSTSTEPGQVHGQVFSLYTLLPFRMRLASAWSLTKWRRASVPRATTNCRIVTGLTKVLVITERQSRAALGAWRRWKARSPHNYTGEHDMR